MLDSGISQPKMKAKQTVHKFGKYYFFIIVLLDVEKTQMSVHDNNHAFIQANNNDVRLMGVHDGLRVFMHQDVASPGVRIPDMQSSFNSLDSLATSNCLKFVPPQLDFKERYLGVPHLERVTLVNTDENKTIHMSSVSGNTLHFHSSFFQDKTIPPKGNTSFAIVFLGRNQGRVSSTLFIHTSEGTFKYEVSGTSIESPYRLRPLGGVRLPLHAAFQSMIHLHNPHHFPIQVVEVYSSGREFHLELPGGEIEGPKSLWQVPPYMTQPVIRASFQADMQSNHTAYIRIKLNNTEQVLIVPLEVEVSSQSGLYSPNHIVDFGFGGSLDRPKKVKLYLCNSSKKSLRIQSVSTLSRTKSVHVDFEPLKISTGTVPVPVADLVFDWKAGFESGETSGKLVIKTKQGLYKLVVPYIATVFEGGLKVDETATRFLTTESKFQPRNVTVSNRFKIPIAINNVSLSGEASKYFQIKKFKPIIIPPDKSLAILTISAKDNSSMRNLKLNSQLIFHTNISEVTVPVLSYNGKLTKIFPPGFEDLELLDLGLVSSVTVKKIKFGLQNNNPVPVQLVSVSSNSASIVPKLLGVYNGNVSSFLRQFSFTGTTNLTRIKPNSIAVIEVGVHAPNAEQTISADITVVSQYEDLVLPVKASVAHGTLEVVPQPLLLDECFPGKICTLPLNVRSTFNRPMTVIGVSSVPPDPRLGFSISNAGNTEILASSSNQIGDLKWEPGKYCGNHCYLGVVNNSTSGILQWSQSDVLPPYTSDADATLIRDKYQRFLNLTKGNRSGFWQDLLLRLDTNEVREQPFKAKVKLIWPRISNASKLVFPLTQVMNTTIQRLKLVNTASHAVIVQLVMEWAYPQAKRLLDSFPQSLKPHCGEDCFNSTAKEFFILKNFAKFSESYGIVNATLSPGESYEAIISYKPRSPQKSFGLLFVRSNLTIIEIVELQGQAAFAQLKFGNRKPGSENPLTFEITDKHLKDCTREKSKKSQAPNLTVKRSFVARNIGQLPIFIHGFRINGLDCEGYGFSVLNCEPFLLAANGTKKIDVAFTPDFTLSKIQRTLTVETSSGIQANYTLVTTLPPFFLSACTSVLTRPAWEPLLYYSAVSFMVFLLFCVLAAAFFESDRILKCALMTMARDRNSPAVPLDLRQIGTGVAKELGGHGKKAEPPQVHDGPDKSKPKEASACENVGPCWPAGFSTDDRRYSVVSNDDKYDAHEKSEDPVEYLRDKERLTRSFPNNLRKNKKAGKKNCNNTETAAAEMLRNTGVVLPCDKTRHNNEATNVGWGRVFSKESSNNNSHSSSSSSSNNNNNNNNNNNHHHEKIKLKLGANETESCKQIRNDMETRKEDASRKNNKNKKNNSNNNNNGNNNSNSSSKGLSRQDEEDSSSTTTDSLTDAEKDSTCDSRMRIAKNENLRKSLGEKKTRVQQVQQLEDSSYQGDCDDDDDFEKERKKTIRSKNLKVSSCKMNSKLTNNGQVDSGSSNIWKPNAVENVDHLRSVDFTKQRATKNIIVRDGRKEKNNNKRRFAEKTGIQKVSEVSTTNSSSPCWEHRSFSDVVARNENPLLRSNCILTSKSNQQKQYVSDSGYTDMGKRSCESSFSSVLGPIGSKKPASNWSSMYNNTCTRNLFNYTEPPPEMNSALEFRKERNVCIEDTLPPDLENLWDDRTTQPLNRPENHYQFSWKENWTDFWGNSRNPVRANDGPVSVQDGLTEQSWSSLFPRSSWSPSPWSPSTGVGTRRAILDNNMDDVGRFAGYQSSLDEPQDLVGCLASCTLPVSPPDRNSDVLDRSHFGRNSIPSDTAQMSAGDESVSSPLRFDPFHSLNSIWSPKAPDTWTLPGN